MKTTLGHSFMYNIIIVFILLTLGFMFGAVTYYRSFKVNTLIVKSIEKYEGYNTLALREINQNLTTIAYPRNRDFTCPTRGGSGAVLSASDSSLLNHRYCVYEQSGVVTEHSFDGMGHNVRFSQYTVVTYIDLDFPGVGKFFKVPVVAKTNRIYCFEGGCF